MVILLVSFIYFCIGLSISKKHPHYLSRKHKKDHFTHHFIYKHKSIQNKNEYKPQYPDGSTFCFYDNYGTDNIYNDNEQIIIENDATIYDTNDEKEKQNCCGLHRRYHNHEIMIPTVTRIHSMFHMIDKNRDDIIDQDELKKSIKEYHPTQSDNIDFEKEQYSTLLDKTIAQLDSNMDGIITKHEYITHMTYKISKITNKIEKGDLTVHELNDIVKSLNPKIIGQSD